MKPRHHITAAGHIAATRRVGWPLLLAGLVFSPATLADWSGAFGLTSNNIERGVTQSDRDAR